MPAPAVRIAVFAAVAAVATATGNPQAASTSSWISTWSASQETLSSTSLTNRTVRMIARVTIGGDAVRLRLDNTFGSAPVTIGRVFLGIQRSARSGDSSSRSAALLAGSNKAVTFGGATTVTIPAGGTVRSDPVPVAVLPQQDLAISLYVPGTSVHASAHSSAQVHSFMTANGAGDLASDEAKTAFTSGTTSMFWLKAIEVRSTSTGAVAVLGDSITDGTCSTVDAHDRWLDWVATRLHIADGSLSLAVLNEGIGGNTVTAIRSNSAIERFDRDVLSHPGLTDVIVFSGINDINRGAGASQVIAGLQELIARAGALGIRVIGATLIPRADVAPTGSWTTTKTSIRNAVNTWIRTSGAYDAVVDFDAFVRDPSNPNVIRPAFNCDDVHPTPRGYYEIGRLFPLAVLH